MALSKQIRQVQFLLYGWIRYIRRRYLLFSALACLGLLLTSLVSQDPDSTRINQFLRQGEATSPPGFLHVLVTASSADVNLCKTVISAILAGYPLPTLINWSKQFDEKVPSLKNPHIAKITGVHEYLVNMDSSHDEDLVLVVDGYDIWFQLGPQLLIDRYHELCRRGDKRIAARLGSRAIEELNIRQRIIFSAQKECWPGGDEDLNCYAVPNSTLPKDIYGPDTDKRIDDENNPSAKFRQRYLSSGIVIGPLAEMRKMYKRAMTLYNENTKLGSDQAIFSHIHGQQEYQREVIRLKYPSWDSNSKSWLQERILGQEESTILDPHPTRLKMEPADGAPYDYSIGLDYTSSLGQATVFAENDADWIVFKDTKTIAEAYDRMNVTNPNSYLINKDVSLSLPPFWTTSRLDVDIPKENGWSNVMLYTNLYTGVTPAIIHHNAHKGNLKRLREGTWDRMWFQPHVRDFLRARLHEPYRPAAIGGRRGEEKAWWGPTEKRSSGLGAQPDTSDTDWVSWEMMVDDDWSQELFRDDGGPWREAP